MDKNSMRIIYNMSEPKYKKDDIVVSTDDQVDKEVLKVISLSDNIYYLVNVIKSKTTYNLDKDGRMKITREALEGPGYVFAPIGDPDIDYIIQNHNNNNNTGGKRKTNRKRTHRKRYNRRKTYRRKIR